MENRPSLTQGGMTGVYQRESNYDMKSCLWRLGGFHIRGGTIPQNQESYIVIPSACCEIWNWESENDSFSIPFMNPLTPTPVPIPPKYAKEPELRLLGIGIVPPLPLRRHIPHLPFLFCFPALNPSFLPFLQCL